MHGGGAMILIRIPPGIRGANRLLASHGIRNLSLCGYAIVAWRNRHKAKNILRAYRHAQEES